MPEALAMIIAAIVASTATGVGAGVQSRDLNDAKAEQQRMFGAQTQVGKENNAYMMHQQSIDNQNTKDRFNLDVQNRNYSVIQNQIQQVENLLNTNIGLRDKVLSQWGK